MHVITYLKEASYWQFSVLTMLCVSWAVCCWFQVLEDTTHLLEFFLLKDDILMWLKKIYRN